jgi:hypothetical protein
MQMGDLGVQEEVTQTPCEIFQMKENLKMLF